MNRHQIHWQRDSAEEPREFELAYLAALTQAGLKPLSRWEGTFDSRAEDWLHALGLKTRVVERSVQSGRRVRELLLSPAERCLDQYARCFDRAAVAPDPASVRLEGRLFGYPSCCTESYLARGYAANSLRRADQRILFHWACPQCRITPGLLPPYRRIFRRCRRTWRSAGALRPSPNSQTAALRRRSLALAASLGLLGAVPGLITTCAHAGDPHWLPLPTYDDPDGDFLASTEEVILGQDPANPDRDGNGQPDGPGLALAWSATIDTLTTKPSATEPYLVHHLAFGLENCQVCGAQENMGFITIVNPLENQSLDLPYLAKHFLDHGSFSYAGTVHAGRVNPPLLAAVLTSAGLAHFLAESPENDADNDGLRDWEEHVFLSDPANRDTDGNRILDGIDVMRALRAQLGALPRASSPETGPKDQPFVVEHPMDGVETCPRCGERVVMDLWDVINPLTHASVRLPSMALHYLEHGGPAWKGGQLLGGAGRVNPCRLRAVLTGQYDGHWLEVNSDTDGDLLADAEETALGKSVRAPDEDANQMLDGADLARSVAVEIAALPTAPGAAVYRLDFPLRGLERCDVCGTNANMGHLTVCNPVAGLSVDVHYLGLHYLEHGSFSFAGDVHGEGRSEIGRLLTALHRLLVVTASQTSVTLHWFGQAGRTYQVQTALVIPGPWSPGPTFTGTGSELIFTDADPAASPHRFYRVKVW
jgi:hypothetical protein